MKTNIRLGALLAVLLLAGCENYNDRNIRDFKKCQAAGMRGTVNFGGGITCVPPADVKP